MTDMMTVDEMREARTRLHYTYEMVAEKSGVPLSTVQKVFSGTTDRPHYKTMTALEAVFRRADKSRYDVYTDISGYGVTVVKESGPAQEIRRPLTPRMLSEVYMRYLKKGFRYIRGIRYR